MGQGKVNVKSSQSRSKIRCMENHTKPTLRMDQDHIILCMGANNLRLHKNSELVLKTVQLVLKTKLRDVFISCITAKNDQHCKFSICVKREPENLCLENNLDLIHHESTSKLVNGWELCLSKRDIKILFNSFTEAMLYPISYSNSFYSIVLIMDLIGKLIITVMNIILNLLKASEICKTLKLSVCKTWSELSFVI